MNSRMKVFYTSAKENKYYRLNDEDTIGDTDLNLTMESDSRHSETVVNKDNFPSEVSLIDMIKENMLREKLQDQE